MCSVEPPSRGKLEKTEFVASWEGSQGNSVDDSSNSTFVMTRTMKIGTDIFNASSVNAAGANQHAMTCDAESILLPISLIKGGEIMPFGIATLVTSDFARCPSEINLPVRNVNLSKKKSKKFARFSLVGNKVKHTVGDNCTLRVRIAVQDVDGY